MTHVKNWDELLTRLNLFKQFIVQTMKNEAAADDYDSDSYVSKTHRAWHRKRLQAERQRLEARIINTLKDISLDLDEHWAEHWRDDDSPQYERSFGTCLVA